MIKSAQKIFARTDLKRRQTEIEQRLSLFGLRRRPHGLLRLAGGAEFEGTYGRRLRLALEGLGPVFASFGLYLSTRVDLLPAKDCIELKRINAAAAATPVSDIRALLRGEIGCRADEAYAHFDDEPFEARLLYQSHRAYLSDGSAVIVKILRPEVEQQAELDLKLLPLLSDRFTCEGVSDSALNSAAFDFLHTLGRHLSFVHEAQAIESLALDASGLEMLRVPRVQRELSTSRVLTLEHLPGLSLSDIVSSSDVHTSEGDVRRKTAAFDRKNIARLACAIWLRQALLGSVFPVEPNPRNILVLSDKQIAFTGGVFASLPSGSQSNLWDYLMAAAKENPDRACSSLLKEVTRESRALSEDDLRHRFRQLVPFRDSDWYRDGNTNHLAEHLFTHWRLASACGYLPQTHLPSFYRGLFTIAETAEQLFPGSDPLFEGLQDARMLASLAQFREMMSLHQLGEQADKYAAMLMELPQKMDEVLRLASSGNPRIKLHVPEADHQRQQRNSTTLMTAMLFLLASVALLLPLVTTRLAGGVWATRLSAIIFLLLGAMMLTALSRVG